MDKEPCSHEGCAAELPTDEDKIPPGWTVLRVEEYTKTTVKVYYAYLCPQHKVSSAARQQSLFGGSE